MIRDKNVEWLEKRIYLPVWSFQSQTDAAATAFLAAGVPVMQEVGTTNLAGGQVAAAGDAFTHAMMVPYDLDRSKQVRVRVWFVSTSVDADIITWLVNYGAVAENVALVEPATALSTPVPAKTRGIIANAVEATDFGVINKNVIPAATAFLNWYVEADSIGAASANEISLLGLEIRYTPRKMGGPEKNLRGGRRLATAFPLGVTLHPTQEG